MPGVIFHWTKQQRDYKIGKLVQMKLDYWTTNFNKEYVSRNSLVLAKNQELSLEVLKSKIPVPLEKHSFNIISKLVGVLSILNLQDNLSILNLQDIHTTMYMYYIGKYNLFALTEKWPRI